jgi:hypothetical protein
MYFVSLYPTKRATLRLKRKGEPLGPFTVSKGRMLSGMLSGGWKGGVVGVVRLLTLVRVSNALATPWKGWNRYPLGWGRWGSGMGAGCIPSG